MMKSGHSYSGLAAGLGLAIATDAPTVIGLIGAGLVGGAALLPDWDQPESTVSRVFGPVSQWVADGINWTSSKIYAATATDWDDDRDGGHRGITHTLLFAVALGGVASLAAHWTWGLAAVLFLCVSLALRGLLGNWARRRGWLGTTIVSAGLTALLMQSLPDGYGTTQLGLLVGLGCFVHCLGDSLTISGCPWLFPLVIDDQRWYPIGTPEGMRFRAGGAVEKRYVMPFLVAGTVLVGFTYVPDGWSAVGDIVAWVADKV